MRTDVIVLLGFCLMALAAFVSCKADEERILDRYEERYTEMAPEFPDSRECGRYASSFAIMDRDLEAASKEMVHRQQQAARMWQQGYISEGERNRQQQEYADAYMGYQDARVERLRNGIGWSGAEFYYCYARVNMSNDPAYCSTLADSLVNVSNAGLDLGDYHVIGIEFCLEQSPDFLKAIDNR